MDDANLNRFPELQARGLGNGMARVSTLIDAPFDNPDWVFESKWDGFRLVASIEEARPRSTRATARPSLIGTRRLQRPWRQSATTRKGGTPY
jgi:hypothetical protein